MVTLRLVERTDGTWCAYVEGHEEDAVTADTDDAAVGRLVRAQPGRFGVAGIQVGTVSPGLRGEPAGFSPEADALIGPDSAAPEFRHRDAKDVGP